MIPERLFRRLDRARLERRVLAASWEGLRVDLLALAEAHARYRAGARVRELVPPAQRLVDDLGRAFELPPKLVFLRDSPRPHRRRQGRIAWELHGECDPAGPLEVFTRTAARAQPVALKSMVDTLLHEWVHHYDFSTFGESVHCKGFYERLAQVYRPARDVIDGTAGADAGAG